ncbi:MAG: hypothetical protein Q9170_007693 [Blastenia crenularia]
MQDPDRGFLLHADTMAISISNKITMTGPAYEHAMQHLQTLGFPEKIRTSGTDQLSDAIQRYLRDRYHINSAGSEDSLSSDSRSDAPEDEV